MAKFMLSPNASCFLCRACLELNDVGFLNKAVVPQALVPERKEKAKQGPHHLVPLNQNRFVNANFMNSDHYPRNVPITAPPRRH